MLKLSYRYLALNSSSFPLCCCLRLIRLLFGYDLRTIVGRKLCIATFSAATHALFCRHAYYWGEVILVQVSSSSSSSAYSISSIVMLCIRDDRLPVTELNLHYVHHATDYIILLYIYFADNSPRHTEQRPM